MIALLRPEFLAPLGAIGVAIVGGIAKVIVELSRVRSENTKQHKAVGETLVRVETKVDLTHELVRDVAIRLDDHINGPQHTQQNVIVHPRHVTGGNSDVA